MIHCIYQHKDMHDNSGNKLLFLFCLFTRGKNKLHTMRSMQILRIHRWFEALLWLTMHVLKWNLLCLYCFFVHFFGPFRKSNFFDFKMISGKICSP